MNDKIIIGVRHPLKFSEEATTEKFAGRLCLFDLEGLLHTLFVCFKELIGSQFIRKVSKRSVITNAEATHYHVMFLICEIVKY